MHGHQGWLLLGKFQCCNSIERVDNVKIFSICHFKNRQDSYWPINTESTLTDLWKDRERFLAIVIDSKTCHRYSPIATSTIVTHRYTSGYHWPILSCRREQRHLDLPEGTCQTWRASAARPITSLLDLLLRSTLRTQLPSAPPTHITQNNNLVWNFTFHECQQNIYL